MVVLASDQRRFILGDERDDGTSAEEFNRLSLAEQREFSAAILRRAVQLDYGDITDEELTTSAARMFALLDEEENAQAR